MTFRGCKEEKEGKGRQQVLGRTISCPHRGLRLMTGSEPLRYRKGPLQEIPGDDKWNIRILANDTVREQTEKIGGLGKVIDSFKMNLSFGDRSTFSLE